MKKLFYYIIPFALLAACQTEEATSLTKLKSQKDSLVSIQKEVSGLIKELDVKIALIDSSQKLHTVSVLKLEPKNFKHYFKVYGQVESNKSISLYSETSGRIESILVKRGQNVAKGQLLATIDANVLNQNIAEVKTSLELANELYKKQSKLWLEDKIGSEVQYLEAKNRKESLERKLETLQAQLSMTKVRAPFNGVIDDIFPKNGEMASPQTPMFRLVNLGDVYLTASVSEAYVGKIISGTRATVTFESLGETVETSVIRVGNYINPDNRTFDVNIALNNNSLFKPNMMGSVNLEDYSKENAIVVPSRLIMENTKGDSYVYTFNEKGTSVSTVTKTFVTVGVSYQGETEVLEGLHGDEVLVDRGSRSVKDGQKVRRVTLQ